MSQHLYQVLNGEKWTFVDAGIESDDGSLECAIFSVFGMRKFSAPASHWRKVEVVNNVPIIPAAEQTSGKGKVTGD